MKPKNSLENDEVRELKKKCKLVQSNISKVVAIIATDTSDECNSRQQREYSDDKTRVVSNRVLGH